MGGDTVAMEAETRVRELDTMADGLNLEQADTDGLVAVSAALGDQPRLRGALSDPALRGDERAQLAATLLSGRVSAKVAELVGAAAARSKGPSDLEALVERIAIRAVLQHDGEIDAVIVDMDQDGAFDLGLYDTDYDGKPDLKGYFRPGADEPYRYEEIED